MADYVRIPYLGKENTTVEQFLQDNDTRIWNLSKQSFLDYEEDTGYSNLERIYENYNEIQKAEYKNDWLNGSLSVIFPNTDLIIPKTNTDLHTITLYGDNQYLNQKQKFFTYWSDNYNALITNDGFVKTENLTVESGVRNIKSTVNTQIINENLRVWVWCRALNSIINLSPFISNLNTSKGEGAGSFNIIADPIVDLEEIQFSGSGVINYFNTDNPSKSSVLDFFSKHFQKNDVVFIRYEKLNLEQENEDSSQLDRPFEINKTLLVGESEDLPFARNWDMIGLIDNVRSSYSAQSTDQFVNIEGRDLTKLLIDDGSFFVPVRYVEGSDKNWIWGGDSASGVIQRNKVSGSYDYFFAYVMKSIKQSLGFVINHLSNLGIVPDDLFAAYGDKISKVYEYPTEDKTYLEQKKVKGIWQIVKLFIDPPTEDRRISDDSLANPDGTLFELINKLCQKPFVEFWGDTNGDTFDFVVRQPPTSKEQIQDVVNQGKFITIEDKDLIRYDLEFDERFYSYYQLQPENTFLGEDGFSALAYLPIVYVDRIAEVYGNQRLVEKDNYISIRALKGDKNENQDFNLFLNTLLPDYKYIIESNQYLQFTRRGQITINGDRRIKRGTFIKFNKTNELFYVTQVSHSLSIGKGVIERTTTINVERGMIFDYIKGSMVDYELNGEVRKEWISYFDIIDTELLYQNLIENINSESGAKGSRSKENIKTNFGVRDEVFDFFVNRKQFQ
jgi:hypothetical protein